MKRNIVTFVILGSLILSSCFNHLALPDISSGGEQARETAKSSAKIKIFIPDYRKLAEQNGGRVIAPQTAKIRLSIANGLDTYVQHGELMELDVDSIVPAENAPANLPGGIWSGTFPALECKTYTAGSLKIELLDQNDRVITQGVNQADVVVYPLQTAQAVFFTTPERYNSISGSLSTGEMRFWRVTMMGGYSYKLTLSAEGSYPDIVVFNDDGTFREYHGVSNSANGVIIFDPVSTNDCYLGVWADSGAVSAYSAALSFNFNNADEDFSSGYNGWAASSSGYGASPPVIVVDDGKSILEFNSSPPMNSGGRVILSRTVNFTEPAAISFSVKTDIGGSAVSTFFKFYIDGVEKVSYDGLGTAWKTGTVIIPSGSHEIKWVLEKDSGSYYPTRTNKVWLADISFSPDVTAFLDMRPKGPKDTYVGGFPIQYTAKALRSDGSIRSGVSGIVYSGPGVNADGLFTPPTASGTFTVTASLDGKIVNSDIITVYPSDYLRKPYTNPVTGKTYYGYQGDSGEMTAVLGYVTFTNPIEKNISADGFITLEGESRVTGNLDIFIFKDNDSSLTTYYPLPQGNFRIKIWLRFGPGQYRINVAGQQVFIVTNTCNDTGIEGIEGDPRFLYPSSVVQSDDFRITNLLSDILYGVSNEADKIRKIHDYLVQNTVYDMDSYNKIINNTGEWKPQDALSVLGTRYHFDSQYEPAGHYFAVCEGYSNAAAALLRAAGIEARYVSSTPMNHGWNNVYTGGSWKFLDVTWDDPVNSSTWYDNGPSYVRYNYYLLTTMDGVEGDHPGGAVNYTRSIAPVPVIPKMKGMPDGWY
jgi:transglutaminase-like putative cysteine protease